MKTAYSINDFLEVKSAGGASFSPDGTRVAYLSNITGTSQVFLVPAEGGDPEQLTDFQDAVSFVRFSPTEDVLIFGKAEGGNEQTQFYLLDLATRQITDITTKPEVRYNFGTWSLDGRNICFASNERNGTDFDVYVMDIATFEKHCVFDEGGSCVAEGFSPRSTYIVVRKNHSSANMDLYLCNLETGDIDHITPHEGPVFYAGSLWLPDESAFFLVQDKGKEFAGLARYSLSEGEFRYVFTPDWDIGGATIDRSGKNVAITVNEEGYERMMIYDTETFEARAYRLPAGNVYRANFSESGSHIVFSLGDSRRTSDVWILTLETGESHQLTHSHQGVPPEAMVEPELVRFRSFDGLSVPAFVYRPKGIKEGVKVPVVINIHGGPEGQYQPVYQPVMQYLVHNGYAVIAPNVRGSSGYGESYMALDDVEKRLDSVKDIVALQDHIASMSDMDATKIALYGASYGGFMVLACMAFYPRLWAAGVDIVGIVNFVTFLENTAPYRRALREAEYGSLENDRELLEKISPIHSIEKIEAPLLLIHGANDPRVPLSEAEQVVARLKEVGRHVELLVYPDEGHGIAKLRNKLDAFPKAVEFLDKALA
ncbi:MAG TPA: S9 family peptidase [Candidatus Paceibacterota bacterium]|nr:S9 family peptidase [Candidatus Paceibacterota bacterium]